MIESFKSKSLKRFFFDDDTSQVRPDQVKRIANILLRLDAASQAEDMNLPGLRLHRLTVELRDFWSVRVSRNWREPIPKFIFRR